jgi:hypothetical protein
LKTLNERVAVIERVLRDSEADPRLVVVEARPQGSFAQKTIINPKNEPAGFDADLLVEFQDWGDDPKELLAAVRATLKASQQHADLIRAKKRCVTVDYAGEFHLDVVPCVRGGAIPYIANKETNGWEPTDPDGFTAWLEERNGWTNGYLIPTIRLCKFLRDYKGRPKIKSVILTVLLAQQGIRRAASEFTDLPTTLVLALEDLAVWCAGHQTAPLLVEPTCLAPLRLEDTDWGAFTRQLDSLARRARAAYDEDDEVKSLALWRELFGSRFPAPVTRIAKAKLEGPEEDLYEHYGIPTDLCETVTIAPPVRWKNGFRPGWHFPLQKWRELDFKISSTSVQPPYDVYWKVKNTGAGSSRSRWTPRSDRRRQHGT